MKLSGRDKDRQLLFVLRPFTRYYFQRTEPLEVFVWQANESNYEQS